MSSRANLPTIGWREWVSLPLLGVDWIKAKVDTGARSSALHAFHIRIFQSNGAQMVRFQIHPVQRKSMPELTAEAEVLEHRIVKSSAGHESKRPVIVTDIVLGNNRWKAEVTLISRDSMGFRMLLGRQAVRDRFLVDPGKSFLTTAGHR